MKAIRCRKGDNPRLLAWMLRVELKVRDLRRRREGIQLDLFN